VTYKMEGHYGFEISYRYSICMERIGNTIKEAETRKAFAKSAVRRSPIDRRSGEDKRKLYNLDYFTDGGEERRRGRERRQCGERRSTWARVYKWCSVFLGKKAL
jgi:hypothetical protein